ncbi:hypothetical protein DSO57_1007965 [Entomophthora muscae]|uniref:Uncharacterized protein n=1 Tax=Entomophthora muscae TaxID=34485 RepID=A0ACC2THU9_9FUNG|nr:hypothetical protein DSO57_1007965 [Entomophthora muscae]
MNSSEAPVDSLTPSSVPTATILSSVANLSNTILGSGMLAMPAAFSVVGLGFGLFLIGFAASTSALGLYLLALCAQRVGNRKTSFYAVSQLTYPRASLWVDLAIAIKCFGVSISYLIVVGQLMPQIMEYFGYTPGSLATNRRLWITVFMIVLIPLASMRRLDSLRYTSIIALCSVVYLVMIVALAFLFRDHPIPWQHIHWFKLDWNFLSVLPVFVFGFTCHQNIFSIHNEIIDNSIPRVSRVLISSIGNGSIVYILIGSLGYLTFGDDVESNILSMYKVNTFLTMGRFAVVLLSLFSYPLQCHPCRTCLLKALDSLNTPHKTLSGQTYSSVNPDEASLEDPDTEVTPSASESEVLFFILTAGILLGTFSLALVVEKLDTVLAFVGSTGSTSISFILPGIFYLKLTSDQPPHIFESAAPLLPLGVSRHAARRFVAYCLVIYGVLVMVTCLSFNITKLLK